MSFRGENYLWSKEGASVLENPLQIDYNSIENLNDLFLEVLQNGVHGLCFSLYAEGQKPGDIISEDQIRRRMEIIAPYTKWVRSFSCIEGNELIPKVAKEFGLKTMVGAWLGDDHEMNRTEINALIDMGQKGLVDIAAVGNEVLYRGDLSLAELVQHLKHVRTALPNVEIGYVDAYYEFTNHPELVELSDVILCNCYPFWEGCPLEYSLEHMRQMYYQAYGCSFGKKVIITETGWPSQGESTKGSIPSMEAAKKYFINTQLWAMDTNVEVFYFSSFDESWKVGSEGEVGAYWGLWDKNEKLKL